jgi:hypothetical protein
MIPRPLPRRLSRSLIRVSFAGVTLWIAACAPARPERTGSVAHLGAAVQQRDSVYQAAWLRGDEAALESMLAPGYSYFDGEPGDLATSRKEFPRLKFLEYHYEWREVQALGSDHVLLKNILWMRETLDGKEISGRYWY